MQKQKASKVQIVITKDGDISHAAKKTVSLNSSASYPIDMPDAIAAIKNLGLTQQARVKKGTATIYTYE